MPIRIAMWSGPRNISTAMLRAWENRDDTAVVDEPLYAHYLKATGLLHPGAAEVIAHHEADPAKVIAHLTGPNPDGKAVFYQKHMAHHLLPGMYRSWLAKVTNCFLIRDPREMLTSLAKTIPKPRLEDTGLPQQVEIFEEERERTGGTPIVMDARDVLMEPERTLRRLCERLEVAFSESMLNWPAGPRESDGIWGKHWYDAVWKSTGFEPYRPKDEPVPERLRPLCAECLGYYEKLHVVRMA